MSLPRLARPEEPPLPATLLPALRAVSDPTRFHILTLLLQGEHCVCEITAQLGLPQNLASHHLRTLKKAGLVCDRRDQRDHRWIHYSLNREKLRELFTAGLALFGNANVPERVANCE